MNESYNNISFGNIPREDDDEMNDADVDIDLGEGDDDDFRDVDSTRNRKRVPDSASEKGDLEHFKQKKRAKRSDVWKTFQELPVLKEGDERLALCTLYKQHIKIGKYGTTTAMKRHVKTCPCGKGKLNQQVLQFKTSMTGDESSKLENFKYDHALMRKTVAEFIMVQELPFSLVDSPMFNKMMNNATPFWEKITRHKVKQDCASIYKIEKDKLISLLKSVDKVNITTDMWTSDHQRLGYMTVTGHWIDSSWNLNSRVLNFYNIPPPHNGNVICDELLKCFKEWGIQDKIGSITVDNATSNDSALKFLTENFMFRKKLTTVGALLFHVRCCAHILNLLVQNALKEIDHIVLCVRDAVKYTVKTEGRLIKFADIAKDLELSGKKLVLDNNTRWNSTYKMLATAIEFQAAFPEFKRREAGFDFVPTVEEWKKVKDVCDFLEIFNIITNVISGTSYPTANLFLPEVFRIKEVIDDKMKSLDDDIVRMANRMKQKFDKYWGESNLMMAVASILDPRFKLKLIQFCFPTMYIDSAVANKKVDEVVGVLRELFAEYLSSAKEMESQAASSSSSCSSSLSNAKNMVQSVASGMFKFRMHMSQNNVTPAKSELDIYLEEQPIIDVPGEHFNALEWWKANKLKYKVLSQLAANILSIPITTVASESTFSAGSRVIDPYRASLKPETVQMLLCGADWTREANGLKKKREIDDDKLKEQDFYFPTNSTAPTD